MTKVELSPEIRLTISQANNTEIEKIKGSRFLGFAYPLANIEDMEMAVKKLWEEHPDACHVCWAYRGSTPNVIRAVDDGEPSGTAGKPILKVIEGKGLESVGVAIVRYFGGTKLGTGGLARAYSNATQAVLEECEKKHLKLKCNLSIMIPYSFEGSLLYLLAQQKAQIIDREYTEIVNITATLLVEHSSFVCNEIIERTSGKGIIKKSEYFWA